MPAAIPDALTRRRLGGAVLVLAGIVIALVVVLARTGGDDDPPAEKRSPVRVVSVPPLGLGLAHPRSWRREIDGKVIRLRSPDGSAILTFSSPIAGRAPERVKAKLKRSLTRRLAPARVLRDGPGRLGNRRVRALELLGGSKGGTVRALALVDSTPFRTYAVTLITAARPSRRALVEAQGILATVRFVKPRRG